jgi:hypothetical protein
MLREEDIERFRRMTPDERARIGVDLTDLAWRFLMTLPTEEAQRRLDLSRREPWNPPKTTNSDDGKS